MPAADACILVVEDDQPMQRLLRRTLELSGFAVEVASDGPGALAAFLQRTPDLVLLDVIMPGLDGIEVCRRMRAHSHAPILIISALGREQDKIRGLDAGADDYITKPFSAGELMARVRAVLRRSSRAGDGPASGSSGVLHIGDLEIDTDRYTVRRGSHDILITAIEFRLLAFLAGNAGRVLTHAAILRAVWGQEYEHEQHMLRVNISRLRQKLVADGGSDFIATVPGLGYTVRVG